MRAARLAPDPGSTPRLHLFDGLRGVLAVYVMLGHMAPMLPLTPTGRRIMTALFGHGLAAVDLFFALSGLVIVQSLARFEGRVGAFLIARARRLLPVYYVVLIAAMISLALPTPFAVMPWLHPGDAAHQIWAAGLPASLGAHLLAHGQHVLAQESLAHRRALRLMDTHHLLAHEAHACLHLRHFLRGAVRCGGILSRRCRRWRGRSIQNRNRQCRQSGAHQQGGEVRFHEFPLAGTG